MHRFLPLPLRGSDPRIQADLALDKLAVDLAVRYKLTDISSESASGRRQIAERANAAGAGLIVVGVSGEGSLSHELAIGGTAIKVLRQCHCPVLVVRNPSETAYRRILVATDFLSDRQSRLANGAGQISGGRPYGAPCLYRAL